jgi:spermidine/putrescine transport system ATP-binding protein
MQAELKAIQRRLGMTFVYVTHDQEEALAMSDRVAVMHAGRLLQVDAPQNLYERPANRLVAEFIGECNFLTAQVSGVAEGLIEATVGDLRLQLVRPPRIEVDVGRRVSLAIRPEKIVIQRDATGVQGNRCQARVEDVVYLGTDTRYVLRAAEQLTLIVQEQNRAAGSLAPGAVVALELPGEYLQVLEHDGHG